MIIYTRVYVEQYSTINIIVIIITIIVITVVSQVGHNFMIKGFPEAF
jgi:hypothetical protein